MESHIIFIGQTKMNYNKILEAFQKDAEKLGKDKNSVEQFKLWFNAHKQVHGRKLPQSVVDLEKQLRKLIEACNAVDYILRGASEENDDGMPGIPTDLEDPIYNENMDGTGLEQSFDEELNVVTNVCWQMCDNIHRLENSKESSKEIKANDALESDVEYAIEKLSEALSDLQRAGKFTSEQYDMLENELNRLHNKILKIYNENVQGA